MPLSYSKITAVFLSAPWWLGERLCTQHFLWTGIFLHGMGCLPFPQWFLALPSCSLGQSFSPSPWQMICWFALWLWQSDFMFLGLSVLIWVTVLFPLGQHFDVRMKTAAWETSGDRMDDRGVNFACRNSCALCTWVIFLFQFWTNNLCKTPSNL